MYCIIVCFTIMRYRPQQTPGRRTEGFEHDMNSTRYIQKRLDHGMPSSQGMSVTRICTLIPLEYKSALNWYMYI